MRDPTGKIRIHWLNWQPTPYNDYLFRTLAQCEQIELIVHYRDRQVSSHPWRSSLAEGYNATYYKTSAGVDWSVVALGFTDPHAFFCVAQWNHATTQIFLTLLRLLRRQYVLWTDTPNLLRHRSRLRAELRARWLRWVFSGAARIMGTGRPALQNLARMGASVDRLVNFPFLIDLRLFAPERASPLPLGAGCPVRFLSSGRLDNHLKGHDLAIRALALAASKTKQRFQYFIAGHGPDEFELKELARQSGLKDSIFFLGWVEPEVLPSVYRNSHVLIHPSPSHDPFPNAILEGMAAGLVVLGSDVSGSAVDRIEHGVNGFIHSAGDVSMLAAQITELLQNRAMLPEIGMRARCSAEEWTPERALNTIREIVGKT
jgi:glycosyltransferase involved in cell wall biosynthesis